MPISFACPACATKIKAPDSAAGKKLSCPSCKGEVRVPAAPTGIVTISKPPAPTEADDEPRARGRVEDVKEDAPRRKVGRRDQEDAEDSPRRVSRRDDDDDDRPRKSSREDDYEEDDKSNRKSGRDHDEDDHDREPKGNGTALGLGITSMVIGIIALPAAVVPCCGMFFAVPMGLIGLVFGASGLAVSFSHGKRSMGFPIAGTAVSGLALLITIGWFVLIAGGSAATTATAKAMQDEKEKRDAEKAKSLKSRASVEASLMGKSQDEVLKMLGRPNQTSDGNISRRWDYDATTLNEVTGKPDRKMVIEFDTETNTVKAVRFY